MDIYNIIEAFRENGLNTLDSKDEIDEPRLECIVASIYYSLYKRLPAKQDIDVEKCILILTQWIMHAFDRYVFDYVFFVFGGEGRVLMVLKGEHLTRKEFCAMIIFFLSFLKMKSFRQEFLLDEKKNHS